MNDLDPKGLEAAVAAWEEAFLPAFPTPVSVTSRNAMGKAIRAYLSAAVPAGDGELVERVAMTAEDSARQNGKEPVVKRLEWIDMGEGPRCITVCGAYAIYPSTSSGRPTLSLSGMPKGLFGKFASIEEAKAAAQADYDARIRSALSGDTL